MSPYPERCIMTLSDTPNEPGRVAGVLGLDVEGTTAECTLVARGHSGQGVVCFAHGVLSWNITP